MMMNHTLRFVCLLTGFGIVSPAWCQSGSAVVAEAIKSLQQDDVETLVADLTKEALKDKDAVGFGVAIGLEGQPILERGLGLADLEFKNEVDSQTLFRIGSVTKQFTSALAMHLVEAGRLDLEQEFTSYLPEVELSQCGVTVRQLLNHTSGIPSYTSLGQEWFEVLPLELSDEELLELFADKPFDFDPGSQFLYNNSGYYLLGMLLEEVGGRSYPRLLERELLKDLGLSRIRYDSHAAVIENRAQGYERGVLGLRNDRSFGVSQPGAAGGLIATAGDLVRWQQALVRGAVVSAESYRAMTTATVLGSGDSTGYGFGLALAKRAGQP